MKYFVLMVLVAFGGLCDSMGATDLQFTNHNCSLTIPSNWLIAKAPPASLIVATISTDRLKSLALEAVKIKPGDEEVALPQKAGSLKGLMMKDGHPVTEGEKTLAGISFHTFAGNFGNNVSAVAYLGQAGDNLYMIQTSSSSDDAGKDAEIQSIVSSFRLINPIATASTGKATPGSAGKNTVYLLLKIFGGVLIVIVVVVGVTKLRK